MADIDRLEIGIEAYAGKANSELDKLSRRLEKIEGNLVRINASGLSSFASGIEKLGRSMQAINGINTSAFTKLSKNLDKLASTDSARILQASSAISTMSRSITNAGAAMQSSVNISEMAKNIAKLGGKNVDRAVVILPKLAQELKNLMTTLAQAPNVSKNVIQMTNALANLSNALKGVRSANTENSSTLSRLSGVFSDLSGKTNRASHSMLSFAQIAGKVYASYFLVIRAIKSLGSAIESAMDYVETYNYFSVTMDKIGKDFDSQYEKFGYESAESYANSFTDRLNELTRKMTGFSVGKNGELNMTDSIGLALDPEQIQNFQASVAAVTNSVGLIGEASVNTSKALTMLSADLSSLKNVDLNMVMNNLQSGLIGQSRALYKYGIDITNNTLQTYAYANGIDKAVSEMTQAEKMQLRLLAILDQSKVAWGDQANTINSVANQYRILKQQISNLARIIGNLFLPIVQKVLPVVNGMIIALQRLFTTLGFKIWGGNWLKDTMDGISGGSSNMDDLGDSADDTADAMENAAAAAKKLKTVVLGIDELNINNPNDDSGSGSGSGSGGKGFDLSDAIGDALADYEKVWDEAFADAKNKAQEYADAICKAFSEAFKTGDFSNIGKFISDNITKALNSIDWEKVYEGARFFGKGLATFLNGLITPEEFAAVGRTIAGCLNTAIYGSLSFAENFDWSNFGQSIASGINKFFETFDFKTLAETLNTWVDGIKTTIGEIIENVDWSKVLQGFYDFFSNIEIDTVVFAFGALSFRLAGKLLTNKVIREELLKQIFGKIAESGITISLGTIVATLTSIAFSAPNLIACNDFANELLEKISEAIEDLLPDWAFDLLSKMGAGMVMGSALGMVAGPAGTIAGAIIGGISGALWSQWSKVTAWFDKTIGQWWDEDIAPWFKKEKWDSLFSNIKTSLKSKWDETAKQWKDDITHWWNENVAPWFTEEKWKSLYQKIKDSLKSTWDESVLQWKTNISKWWNENVAPWFTIEKWSTLYSTIKTSLKSKWDETVLQWKSDIQNWWNTHVSPWFTEEKWKTLYTAIKSSLKAKWDETVTQWKTDIQNWWDSHVSPWFTSSKWSDLYNSVKSELKSKWDDAVDQWKSDIKSWWDDHVSPWFTTKKWSDAMGGIKEGFKESFKNAANAAIDVVNKLIKYLNEKLKISWDGFTLPNGDKVGAFSKQLFKMSEIPHFAEGGYPETGQLFMARENGMNEFVGSIGNKSAVANNDQIVAGIKQGVYEAMTEAMQYMMSQSTEQPIIVQTTVELDGKAIVQQTDKARRRMGWNFQPI